MKEKIPNQRLVEPAKGETEKENTHRENITFKDLSYEFVTTFINVIIPVALLSHS